MIRRCTGFAIAAALAFAAPATACDAPSSLAAMAPALVRSAARVIEGQPLTIVAFGSSSTRGVGASQPQLNYPNRLEAELRRRFPRSDIEVVNRGKGGEDVGEEVQRLETDVIAQHPELVVWQLGTNAVLRRDDLAADADSMRRGIARLKETGADVILMDLQSAPRVLERPSYGAMETLLADTAQELGVGLFRRFALMQHWQHAQPADAPALIGPDGLHMTDLSYGCLAVALADSLEANWGMEQKIGERVRVAADVTAAVSPAGQQAAAGINAHR